MSSHSHWQRPINQFKFEFFQHYFKQKLAVFNPSLQLSLFTLLSCRILNCNFLTKPLKAKIPLNNLVEDTIFYNLK